MNKLKCSLFLACLACAPLASAKTILPDSCGDDRIKFDVFTEKTQTPPGSPEAGKAQIVFIEDVERYGFFLTDPTARFGVDGRWAGAGNGNSYFTTSVVPGVHHLCVNWQSGKGSENSKVSMATFTAEASKIYYFQVKIFVRQDSQGWTKERSFELKALEEEEGQYRVKVSKLATWKSK